MGEVRIHGPSPLDPGFDAVDRRLTDDVVLRLLASVDDDRDVEAAAPDERADVVGPYRLFELLGKGATGTVYRARRHDGTRDRALKILEVHRVGSTLPLRFLQEARVLEHLEDECIARFHEADHAEWRGRSVHYIAMELVEGPDLLTWCESRRLDRKEVVALVARIAVAVHHAHGKGIIHRDLKPSNIRVESNGRPKVLDFGAAHCVDPALRPTGLETGAGTVVGTFAYMSPEQLSEARDTADIRHDVYSLGVILYLLLCGRLPVDISGMSVAAAIRAVQDRCPESPSRIDAKLGGDLEVVMNKALAKSPDERYASAAALAADLQHWLADEPIAARSPSALSVVARWTRRHRLMASIVVLTTASIVASLMVALISWQRSEETKKTVVRRLVDFIGLATEFENAAVSIDIRRRFAVTVNGAFADLMGAGSIESDDDAAMAVAEAMSVLSDIELVTGERAACLAHRQNAFDIYHRLARKHPDDISAHRRYSVALVKLGDVKKDLGDRRAAYAHYEESLNLDLRALDRRPDDLGLMDDLVFDYQRMGEIVAKDRGLRHAIEYLRKERDVAFDLYAKDLGRLKSLYALCQALHHFASQTIRVEEFRQEAVAALEAASEFTKRLIDTSPGPVAHRTIYVKVCKASAEVAADRHDFDRAVALETQAETVAKGLVAADGSNTEFRSLLSRLYASQANVFESMGRDDDVLECLMKEMDMAWSAYLLDPDRTQLREDIATISADAAGRLRRMGHDGLADRAAAEAIRMAWSEADRPEPSPLILAHVGHFLMSAAAGTHIDHAAARRMLERSASLRTPDTRLLLEYLARARELDGDPKGAAEARAAAARIVD